MAGDTSLSETRRVVSGGHEEGASGVDDEVEETSLPVWERGRMTMSEGATFSDLPVL